MHQSATAEAKGTTSRLELIRKMLASAEEKSQYIAKSEDLDEAVRKGLENEIEALTERAAELIAKYGIDQAMLADAGQGSDLVIDKVIWAVRPYGNSMQDLLAAVAMPLGAQVRRVKEWDPTAPGGRTKGAWKYGLRLFVHEADMQRIEILFASLRNQALSGASRIKGTAEFGQDQRAYRIGYFDGFCVAVRGRLDRAEQAAKDAAQAEYQERADQAMISGGSAGRSVELVLVSRSDAVRNAFNLAIYGKSTAELEAAKVANRERWAELDKKSQERWEARKAEQAGCSKCHAAKSGYCNDHRDMRPSQGRAWNPTKRGETFDQGYRDGQDADLGARRGSEVGGSRKGIR